MTRQRGFIHRSAIIDINSHISSFVILKAAFSH
jgi:hypothetical protein